MRLDQDQSPWRFLSPLHTGDAGDCELVTLTRTDELRIVTDMVCASRVSLLYAFSGNGKSSLLNAGVVPHFQRLGYAVFRTRPRPPWSNYNPSRAFRDCLLHGMELPLFSQDEVTELREARDLAESLPQGSASEIADVLGRLEAKISRFRLRSPAPEDLLVRLQSKVESPIGQFVAEIRDYLGGETQLLFICDQFEELFVHYNNSPELDEFVAQLGEVWADNSLRVHFLFSMREDWVGSMIAFRKVIPDIFVSYYKLSPLGRKRAADVLTFPIGRLHMSWETEAVEVVLNDLTRSYSESQTNRFNGIDLTPSPTNDPYVELPALQVVADQFWRTRDQHNPPFTLEHYQSLGGIETVVEGNHGGQTAEPEETTSPAQRVLDSYLLEQICKIRDDAGSDADAMKELRLDVLYLLTDRVRHRRALTETGLFTEVRRLRPRELNLPTVDRKLLEETIRPLVDMRLVTEHETPDRQRQFELAHDFAVRSAVREWRRLDQKRTAQIALSRREREGKEKQLGELMVREIRQLKFLRLAPLLGIPSLVAFLLPGARIFSPFTFLIVRLAVFFSSALFAAIITVGASTRQRWSLAAGVVGILGAAVLFAIRPLPDVYLSIAFFAALVLFIVLYIRSLIDLNERLSHSERVQTLTRIMVAEFVDIVVNMVLIVGMSVGVAGLIDPFSGLAFIGATTVLLWSLCSLVAWLASCRILSLRRRTVGFAFGGLLIETEEGRPLPFWRAIIRQLLFLVWSIANAFFLLPFLVLTPLFVRKQVSQRNFYDTWVGAFVRRVRSSRETSSAGRAAVELQSSSRTVAAA